MNKIIDQLTSDYHLTPEQRHWDPESEEFTGMDALFYAVQCDWKVSKTVFCEKNVNRHKRQVRVFTFILTLHDQIRYMSVIETPHVLNFISLAHLSLVGVGENQHVETAPLPLKQPVFAKVG
jgi:hypothetical protein